MSHFDAARAIARCARHGPCLLGQSSATIAARISNKVFVAGGVRLARIIHPLQVTGTSGTGDTRAGSCMSAWLKKSRPCDRCPSDFPPMTHESVPIRCDRNLRAKLRLPQQRYGPPTLSVRLQRSVSSPVRERGASRSATTPLARGGSSSGETRSDARCSPPARRS
jgi:hypothetical protein